MYSKYEKDLLARISVEKSGGLDGLFKFLFFTIILLFVFGIPFVVLGFLFPEGHGMLIMAYVGCGLLGLAVALIFFISIRRQLAIKKYDKEYKTWKNKSFKERWGWIGRLFKPWWSGLNLKPEEPSAAAKALQNAAMRSAWGYVPSSSGGSGSSNSSNNTTRVKLKDGKELHTEERFGDYKTYLYDESGKNTGLHVQGDKVLDDNYNEVGSFDASGKFNPKN